MQEHLLASCVKNLLGAQSRILWLIGEMQRSTEAVWEVRVDMVKGG